MRQQLFCLIYGTLLAHAVPTASAYARHAGQDRVHSTWYVSSHEVCEFVGYTEHFTFICAWTERF